MAIIRRVNQLGQMREETSDLRAIESAASGDFDLLAQSLISGSGNPYIINGFAINFSSNPFERAASSLQVVVSGGSLLHTTASQSGTFYLVPTGTPAVTLNAATTSNVSGSFVPSSNNYVGIDYYRFQDPTTDTQRYLWDPSSNQEDQTIAPAAIIMNYEFVITPTVWASNILPIAIVTTDSGNNVTSVTDSRPLLFRLGTGGTNPNPFFSYSWPEGTTENPVTSTTLNPTNPFFGGDKAITDMKDWIDAVESGFLATFGGPYWYSFGSSPIPGGSIPQLREDATATLLTGTGAITHSATTAGLMNWSSPINIDIVGSNLTYQIATNPSGSTVQLSDQQVAYLNLSRDVTISSANLIWTNTVIGGGEPTTQNPNEVKSVGQVTWTTNLVVGDWIKITSASHAGYYQISALGTAAVSFTDSAYAVTLTSNYTGTNTGPTGAQSQYAFGEYTLPGVGASARQIQISARGSVPTGPNLFWLFARIDDSGAIPRVYIRWLDTDLQQGDSEEISGPQIQNVLTYIGSPIESATQPKYVSAYNVYEGFSPTVLPQKSTVTTIAGSGVSPSQYFVAYSSGDYRTYTVWFKVNGSGSQPAVPNTNDAIEVDILSTDSSSQVATKLATAMNNFLPFDDFTASPASNVVTITNNSAGVCSGVTNGNTPFAFATTQVGTGTGNYAINDADNLTLAVKKLDFSLGNLAASLDSPTYDETVEIVASGATPPTSLNGPVANTTLITLPNNSRESSIAQFYTVGKGTLQVYLNGQFLDIESGAYSEVGTAGAPSNQIEILTIPGGGLVVGDELEFRLGGGGGGGGGLTGPPGPAGPTGATGPAGADALNGPINISTKTSSYVVLSTDGFLLADTTGGNIIFTLPTAASSNSKVKYFKKISSDGNTMTIMGAGSELIDGLNTVSTNVQYVSFSMVSNGSFWSLF